MSLNKSGAGRDPPNRRGSNSRLTPTFPKGKQHGKIDPIFRIHQWRYLIICHVVMILAIISNYYLIFGMLFMQLRGLFFCLKDEIKSFIQEETDLIIFRLNIVFKH